MVDKLRNTSEFLIKHWDNLDSIHAGFISIGYVAPFLTYRLILKEYTKWYDIQYHPKNLQEAKELYHLKSVSAMRFNRLGIPLLALTYLAVWNKSSFKNLINFNNIEASFSNMEEIDNNPNLNIFNQMMIGPGLIIKNKMVQIPLIILIARYII